MNASKPTSMPRAQDEFALAQIEMWLWKYGDFSRSHPETAKRLTEAVAAARKELDERDS